MVANVSPIFVDTANLTEVTFVNADGTTPKAVFTAGADGAKLFHINCTSNQATTAYMQVYIHDGTTNYLLGTVPVSALSGTTGGAGNGSVDLLDPDYLDCLDQDGELFIPTGYSVRVAPTVAITSAKTVTLVGIGGNY